MEWMGWNLLLEGQKLWTFLPPLPELDAPLGTYRLTPNAFGSHNISAGWQSNVDLYRNAPPTVDHRNGVSWPMSSPGQEVLAHAISGVQEEGEVVIIPPRYWHQVGLVFVRCSDRALVVHTINPRYNKNSLWQDASCWQWPKAVLNVELTYVVLYPKTLIHTPGVPPRTLYCGGFAVHG